MDLVINEINISKDDMGRYSLNDLHKASGGKDKDRPTFFMRTKGFKETVEFLNVHKRTVSPFERKAGRYNGGTWICEELVLEYAMWLSVEFKLEVMNFFIKSKGSDNQEFTMNELNAISKRIEGDTELASKCGQILAGYKKKKVKNKIDWLEAVSKAQLKLGV